MKNRSAMELAPRPANPSYTGRSLFLINDLHEYINTLENVAASRKVELERVRDEKRTVEKMLFFHQQKEGQTRHGELFTSLQRSDMPPRIRAVLEDNKMLVDKVKKYKTKFYMSERVVAEQRRQFTQLNDVIKKLRLDLKMCKKTPTQAYRAQSQRDTIQTQQRTIRELEHRVEILKKKHDVDWKQSKTQLASAKKESQGLQRQVELLKSELLEKETELRQQTIETRKYQKLNEAARKMLENRQKRKPKRAKSEGQDLTETENGGVDRQILKISHSERIEGHECNSSAKDKSQDDERSIVEMPPSTPGDLDSQSDVHVMLCVVGNSDSSRTPTRTATLSQGDEANQASQSADIEIRTHQASNSEEGGYSREEEISRLQMASGNSEECEHSEGPAGESEEEGPALMVIQTRPSDQGDKQEPPSSRSNSTPEEDLHAIEERAAIKIQAAARGMQARKRVDRMKVQKEVLAANGSKSVKTTAQQSNWIYRHQQQSLGKGKRLSNAQSYKMSRPGGHN